MTPGEILLQKDLDLRTPGTPDQQLARSYRRLKAAMQGIRPDDQTTFLLAKIEATLAQGFASAPNHKLCLSIR